MIALYRYFLREALQLLTRSPNWDNITPPGKTVKILSGLNFLTVSVHIDEYSIRVESSAPRGYTITGELYTILVAHYVLLVLGREKELDQLSATINGKNLNTTCVRLAKSSAGAIEAHILPEN